MASLPYYKAPQNTNMPVVLSKNKTVTAEHMNLRKHNKPISETTKKQTKFNKSPKISSLLLSSLSPNNNNETTKAKKPTSSNSKTKKKNTNFASTTLRSLAGCTAAAAEKVALPEALAISKSKSKRKIKNKVKSKDFEVQNESFSRKSVLVDGSVCGNSVPDDVWCEPRIGFSAADECVVPTKRNLGGRVKISQREHPCSVRRTVNPQTISFLDSDTAFVTTYTEQEVFGTKYYPRTRHSTPEDDAERMMPPRGHTRGNILDMPDRYSAWRLDVDNMSYEELLELGERIGYVNTGLKDDEISRCLRKFKLSTLYALSHNLPLQLDRKCSICQEEYEADDEIGKLNCGHGYHIQCIKQWLAQKNACPVCKNAPVAR